MQDAPLAGPPDSRADVAVIHPVRPWSLGLHELVRARELLYFMVWRDVKLRYRQTLLGVLWTVVQPISMMVVFLVVIHRVGKVPTDGMPGPIFYLAGLLPWNLFNAALSGASNSLVSNQHLLTKVYFPRLLLPLNGAATALVDFVVGLVFLLVLLPLEHVSVGVRMLGAVPAILLVLLFALGLGLFFGSLNAVYRDVRYVVPFLTQLLYFSSAVFIPLSLVPKKWAWLTRLNPLATAIEAFRWCMTGRGPRPGLSFVISTAACAILLWMGALYFRRREMTIVDVV